MGKFRVMYKYSRKIDLGEIIARSIKEAEKKAELIIRNNILLRTEEDGTPCFSILRIKQ